MKKNIITQTEEDKNIYDKVNMLTLSTLDV